jgi:transcription initiation factor TFIIH subunit 4
MDLVEVLGFLFMLSTMELGRVNFAHFVHLCFTLTNGFLVQEYLTENLSTTQGVLLEDLRDYGLIWQSKVSAIMESMTALLFSLLSQPKSRRFSPTRLGTTLTSSSPPLPTTTGASSGPSDEFIVLETNYRIYAYTGIPELGNS